MLFEPEIGPMTFLYGKKYTFVLPLFIFDLLSFFLDVRIKLCENDCLMSNVSEGNHKF